MMVNGIFSVVLSDSNEIIDTKKPYEVKNISKYGFNVALFFLSNVIWLIIFLTTK